MSLSMKEALTILGIKDVFDHPPKLKFIQKRFYQLSLIHHPDRPGGGVLAWLFLPTFRRHPFRGIG